MKTRLSYVTNSSSSSFVIVNTSDKPVSVADWLKDNYEAFLEHINEREDDEEYAKEILDGLIDKEKETFIGSRDVLMFSGYDSEFGNELAEALYYTDGDDGTIIWRSGD